MKISRDALMRVIRAAKMAHRAAEQMQAFLINTGAETVMDRIEGELTDALMDIAGEKLGPGQDLMADSTVYSFMYDNDIGDSASADVIEVMAAANRIKMKEQVKANGGYCPETGYVPPEKARRRRSARIARCRATAEGECL